ncbi:MAG: 16S rRNA (cytosine(967)-C(5))-methyltransferase RsmB [Pseudomonadota bacterium]
MSEAAKQREPLAPGAIAMAHAAAALTEVVMRGCTADDALAQQSTPPAQRAAVRAILAGSLRWYLRLAPAIDSLQQKPGRKPQPQLHALLIVAAHQAIYSRAAAESVVNIAVDAARALQFGAAAGFVNAVLRRLVRDGDAIFAQVDRRPTAALAHPRWFLQQLDAAYGEHAADIVTANNEPPPMTLRVDLSRGTRADYLQELTAAGIEAVAGFVPSAVVLLAPVSVEALPGFAAGRVSVQDAGAQVAALLLDAQPGERVLDACAAPGGKTGHILEHTRDLAGLVAADLSGVRLTRVADNLERLQRTATLVEADLAQDLSWWDGTPFDRILLDAPCSATGVIRRHPDIKLLRRAGDIASFATLQLGLLQNCLSMLRPGGTLVYATCSVLPQENQQVIATLLASDWGELRRLKARELSLPPNVPRSDEGVQLLPRPRAAGLEAATDGFYYAVLTSGGSR